MINITNSIGQRNFTKFCKIKPKCRCISIYLSYSHEVLSKSKPEKINSWTNEAYEHLLKIFAKWYVECSRTVLLNLNEPYLNVKYKLIFLFIVLTGVHGNYITRMKTNNLQEVLDGILEIKIDSWIWRPYYHYEFVEFLKLIAIFFKQKLELYRQYKQNRHIFETTLPTLRANLVYLLDQDGFSYEGVGLHTLKYLYLIKSDDVSLRLWLNKNNDSYYSDCL